MQIRKTLTVAIDPANNEQLSALQELQELEVRLRDAGVVLSSEFDGEAETVKTEAKKEAPVKKETVKTERPITEKLKDAIKESEKPEEPVKEEPVKEEPEAEAEAEETKAEETKAEECEAKVVVTLEQIRALISEITSDDAKRVLAKKALNEMSDENGQPCKNAGMLQKKDYDAIFATFTKIKNGTYEG